mmetsp:Transcript_41671/g.107862  ORF Transcript_41671/g.107862 Transcript_41671/m.107862 type:complete len:540 (+) Transcript_41671:69-1688(+)
MRPSAAARCGLAALALALRAAGAEEENSTTKPYAAPQVEGLHWVETFDGDVWSRWSASKQEKYTGEFKVEKRVAEALVGDVGLLVPIEARHYGASVKFAPIEGKKEVPFVVQFEAKFQDSLTCGGSYIKIFDSSTLDPTGFKDDTPYVIMFGPDKCGGTDKVHFILRHQNPKTGAWEEKHAKEPPSVPRDSLTHLYGLVINPDNSFEVQIDGVAKLSGNLLTSMVPPVNPPKEIDDPADSKPSDWVDEAKIDDPMSSKPDDWDEDEPMRIPDLTVTKPDGWVDDQETRIADPSAKIPEDWDEEEDGEWEAPIIDNPACKVGCGTWEPPKISNPMYKGKWYAPKIDNPEYKGVWSPRQIPNPDYFHDETPCVLPVIDSIGIDIWTMNKGILFDNLVVATDAGKAKAFADQSWKLRKELEELQKPKANDGGTVAYLLDLVQGNLAATAVTCVAVLLTSLWCCCRSSGAPRAPTPAERRQIMKEAKAKSKAKEEAKKAEGEEKEEATEAKEDEAEAEGEKAEEEETKEKPVEGGLGDPNDDN